MTMTPTPTTARTKHVLVVDDEADIRSFLEVVLATSEYDVTLAEDGAQGRLLARSLVPDVVILDVMMPGVDGIEVLRDLRADPVTAEIPVVLLTAKTSDQDTWAGWEAGAAYYMTKPFDIDHLLAFLDSLDSSDDLEAIAV